MTSAHLRIGPMLDAVLPSTASVFARALVMPNTTPPIRDAADAELYRRLILGSPGIFTAPVALPLLAQLFDENDVLDALEPFVSEFGARFYGLPLNEGTIELVNEPWTVPDRYGTVVPFMAGQEIPWKIV